MKRKLPFYFKMIVVYFFMFFKNTEACIQEFVNTPFYCLGQDKGVIQITYQGQLKDPNVMDDSIFPNTQFKIQDPIFFPQQEESFMNLLVNNWMDSGAIFWNSDGKSIRVLLDATSWAPSSGCNEKGDLFLDQNKLVYLYKPQLSDGTPGIVRKVLKKSSSGTVEYEETECSTVDTDGYFI